MKIDIRFDSHAPQRPTAKSEGATAWSLSACSPSRVDHVSGRA